MALSAASVFAAAPTISGFAPASGILGSQVTITGTNFVTPTTVSFGGVASGSVTVLSSTTIKAYVPVAAPTGALTLTTSGGSVTSSSAYTVLPGVSLSAAIGPPTTLLTVYYSGFGAYEPVDLYFDTGDIGLSSAISTGAGNLPFTIPASAHPGVHWITAIGRRSVNSVQISFTVRSNWPQLGFTPNHKANDRYENVLSNATVGSLDEAWQTPFIGDVATSPAVVNGIVYSGFDDGTIRAFDETTGAQKWSYATPAFIDSSPVVANGIVYAGSCDNYLYALDALTGALKWRFATGNYVESAPNVVNGIVYFGSDDNNVYALNATTGALIWRFTSGGGVLGAPMVANGVVYAGSFDDNVYALDAATGAKLWSFTAPSYITASPVLAGGLVCVGTNDGVMYALEASSGHELWTYNAGTPISSSAAAVGGAIFFGCGNDIMYSLSSSGKLRWSTNVGTYVGGPVCVANGVVYATGVGYTFALDQNTGALLTTLSIGSDSGAAVVNGAVFVGDAFDGVLARFTPSGMLSNYVAPRPDPMQLRPHRLR